MVIQERLQQGCYILERSGRMDFKAGHMFQSAMKTVQASGVSHIVFDLREVSFIDSAGLALLILANLGCRELNVRFSLCQSQHSAGDVFELTNVRKHLTIVGTVESALSSTSQSITR